MLFLYDFKNVFGLSTYNIFITWGVFWDGGEDRKVPLLILE